MRCAHEFAILDHRVIVFFLASTILTIQPSIHQFSHHKAHSPTTVVSTKQHARKRRNRRQDTQWYFPPHSPPPSLLPSTNSLAVFGKPLYAHSKNPPTGYARDGFCRAPSEDKSNHSVAGTVTAEFLDFSASKGNDLRKQVNLQPGQKWCLCASRWKEAFDAAAGNASDKRVPKVNLEATDKRALEVVGLKDLKMFASEGEVEGDAITPDKNGRGPVKESQVIGGQVSTGKSAVLRDRWCRGRGGQN